MMFVLPRSHRRWPSCAAKNFRFEYLQMHSLAFRRYGFVLLPLAYVAIMLSQYGLRMLDDGYYYLQIAYNVSFGRGFTFDGTTLTNGFQPLWQIMLVPFFWLIPSKVVVAYVVSCVQTIFFVCSGLMLVRIYGRLAPASRFGWLPGVLWVCNPYFINKGAWTGMETGLFVFTFASSLMGILLFMEGSLNTAAAGLLLMLTLAARLDAVFFVVLAAAGLASRCGVRALLCLIAPSVAFLAVDCTVNYHYFGHIMPISGFVKSHHGDELLGRLLRTGDPTFFTHAASNLFQLITLNYRFPVWALLVLGSASAWLLVRSLHAGEPKSRLLVFMLGANAVSLILYYACFYDEAVATYSYYWFPIELSAVLLVPWMIEATSPAALASIFAFSSVIATAAFAYVYVPDLIETFAAERPVAQAASYINQRLPKDAIIGSWDAGYLGFYSDRSVVNLDNLVNNYELFEATQRDQLPRYLEKKDVTYLANVDYGEGRRGWIEHHFDARLVYDQTWRISRLTTRFTVSPWATRVTRSSDGEMKFFIYEIKPKQRTSYLLPVPRKDPCPVSPG